MIRSFVFQNGKLLGQDVELIQVQTLIADPALLVWVDLDDPTDLERKTVMEDIFKFHPLTIEDCMTLSDTPKVEDYETYVFMVIHAVDFSRTTEEFTTAELDLFVGKNFLVTYHRQPLRSVQSTMDRCRKSSVHVARAPDRLAHTLLDFLFENYRPVIEELAAEIAVLEERVLTAPSAKILGEVLKLKQEVQHLRRIITPQREIIARFARGEYKFVRTHLLPYYRDLLDQLVRISDLAESYRDSLTNLLLVQLNLEQAQTNQVIKVLTVVATLSLPLLVVTSFYGMNFANMPELQWDYGYLWVFGVSGVCVTALYLFLKSRKWL